MNNGGEDFRRAIHPSTQTCCGENRMTAKDDSFSSADSEASRNAAAMTSALEQMSALDLRKLWVTINGPANIHPRLDSKYLKQSDADTKFMMDAGYNIFRQDAGDA